MEIDKTLALQAPPQRVWALLLDPQAMGACVPGMESVEVVSADEYVALMKVKIAFINARFKLRTRIIERHEPHHLVAEGTGEDASVSSSLKQRTEMRLEPRTDGGTDLRLTVQVDLLGRMGSFGLSAMKTKADRLWEEFGANLAARLAGGAPVAAAPTVATPLPTPAPAAAPPQASVLAVPGPATAPPPAPAGWWPRLLRALGIQPLGPAASLIVVELRRPDQTQVRIEWPAERSDECARWLRDALH